MKVWRAHPAGGHPIKHQPGIHRIPDNDVREHLNLAECWCQPQETVLYTVRLSCGALLPVKRFHHRAADGREGNPS